MSLCSIIGIVVLLSCVGLGIVYYRRFPMDATALERKLPYKPRFQSLERLCASLKEDPAKWSLRRLAQYTVVVAPKVEDPEAKEPPIKIVVQLLVDGTVGYATLHADWIEVTLNEEDDQLLQQTVREFVLARHLLHLKTASTLVDDCLDKL